MSGLGDITLRQLYELKRDIGDSPRELDLTACLRRFATYSHLTDFEATIAYGVVQNLPSIKMERLREEGVSDG